MVRNADQVFNPDAPAQKQRWREEEARALGSGDKTAQQLREENEVFAKLEPLARADLTASLKFG